MEEGDRFKVGWWIVEGVSLFLMLAVFLLVLGLVGVDAGSDDDYTNGFRRTCREFGVDGEWLGGR